jgi:hypothetical protein
MIRFMILINLILFVGITLQIIYYGAILKSKPPDVKLWMTYDEVQKIMPHDRKKLTRNLNLNQYEISDEETRCYQIYGIDLEDEYGIILGLNASREVVFINRVTRANKPHYSDTQQSD